MYSSIYDFGEYLDILCVLLFWLLKGRFQHFDSILLSFLSSKAVAIGFLVSEYKLVARKVILLVDIPLISGGGLVWF